ncbi:unnamed protein product [Staurois parvus]|uniref:Uncharacterized protein n=1 Tax=Staurois parvus TaxID=386267 RepID=A0ABN9B097_9NEOB|nr:unnamed protein product [Staurois parvus]
MICLKNFIKETNKLFFFFKFCALFLFIAQKVKCPVAIKYHQKKVLFVRKK